MEVPGGLEGSMLWVSGGSELAESMWEDSVWNGPYIEGLYESTGRVCVGGV